MALRMEFIGIVHAYLCETLGSPLKLLQYIKNNCSISKRNIMWIKVHALHTMVCLVSIGTILELPQNY